MLCDVRPCRSYIEKHFGGAENFSTQDLQQAMTHMRENLDGSDKGQTISESEVEDHLRSLMQVRVPVSCRQLTIVLAGCVETRYHASYHHALESLQKGAVAHTGLAASQRCQGRTPAALASSPLLGG